MQPHLYILLIVLILELQLINDMPRGKKKASHSCAPPPPPSHKFCTYCQVHQVVRTFAKHQRACKRIWQMDREPRGVNRTMGNSETLQHVDEMVIILCSLSSVYLFALHRLGWI